MTREIKALGDAASIDLAREAPFRLGSIEVRPATRELTVAGETHSLEPRVMQVLVAFARARGEVVTRDDLIACCWDGRIVGEDAINRVISRIHRLAELDGGRGFALQTIRGVGYRLTAADAPVIASAKPPLGDPAEPVAVVPQHHVDAPGDAPAAESAPPAPRGRIARAVPVLAATLALVIAGTGLWLWSERDVRTPAPTSSAAADAPLTLAVLPFDNLTGTPADAFLADGLAREVRNRLSRMRGLRVIADSSSFAVAGQRLTATEMGTRLGADLLLDGGVQRAGGRLRVSTELVDARSGVQVWQDTRELAAGDLFQVQEAVSGVVTQELLDRLGPDRVQVLAPPRSGDARAFRRVLQATELYETLMSLDQRGEREAALKVSNQITGLVDEALALDPESPGALLMKGRLQFAHSTAGPSTPPARIAERRAAAAAFARRALAADPNDPAALTTLAEQFRRGEWRWREAETLYRRALAVDPNHVDAHTWYAYFLSTTGRCRDGLAHARTAARLDPEFTWRSLGEPRLLYCMGDRAGSMRLYADLLGKDRSNVFLLREIYLKHLVQADPAGLRQLVTRVRGELWSGEPPTEPIAATLDRALAAADALEGRPAALLALVEADAADQARITETPAALGRRNVDVVWTLAMEFAWAGRPERALDMLIQAMAGGSLYIPETLPHGAHDFTPAVRGSPRYRALWREDPRLLELTALRLQAVRDGQMPSPTGDPSP